MYSFLLTLFISVVISLVIVPLTHVFVGAGYGFPFCIFISSSAKVFNSALLSTKSFNCLRSVLDKPGTVIPCLVHTATREACEKVNLPTPVNLDKLLGKVFKLFFNALKSFAAAILAFTTAISALL